ncbi:MAG: hypothetical protein M1832_000764 [Thelocarpon impressellum]|nr:MAG: hypothetical protein M1832_000764 [Thelocarpon impressellum]
MLRPSAILCLGLAVLLSSTTASPIGGDASGAAVIAPRKSTDSLALSAVRSSRNVHRFIHVIPSTTLWVQAQWFVGAVAKEVFLRAMVEAGREARAEPWAMFVEETDTNFPTFAGWHVHLHQNVPGQLTWQDVMLTLETMLSYIQTEINDPGYFIARIRSTLLQTEIGYVELIDQPTGNHGWRRRRAEALSAPLEPRAGAKRAEPPDPAAPAVLTAEDVDTDMRLSKRAPPDSKKVSDSNDNGESEAGKQKVPRALEAWREPTAWDGVLDLATPDHKFRLRVVYNLSFLSFNVLQGALQAALNQIVTTMPTVDYIPTGENFMWRSKDVDNSISLLSVYSQADGTPRMMWLDAEDLVEYLQSIVQTFLTVRGKSIGEMLVTIMPYAGPQVVVGGFAAYA